MRPFSVVFAMCCVAALVFFVHGNDSSLLPEHPRSAGTRASALGGDESRQERPYHLALVPAPSTEPSTTAPPVSLPVIVEPMSPQTTNPPQAWPADYQGWPSEAWLRQLALCESGLQDGWRTGWFGIEAGHAIGGLSWDEQVAWVRQILGDYGPSAWSSYTHGCVGAP